MQNKLIKPIIQLGTSAGVILPRKWLNGTASIELIEEPINPSVDIIKILEKNLYDIKGVYLTGSYARNEQDKDSDIDILVITNGIKGKIKKGRYEIIMLPEKNIKSILDKTIFPLLPMIKESVAILNKELISPYRNHKINKGALKNNLKLISSAIAINKEDIKLVKELKQDKLGDGTSYSLVLRLRELYILNCLKKDKLWSKKEFIYLIKKIAGTTQVYDGYINIKKGFASKKRLSIEEAEKLIFYIEKELKKWEETRS